MAKTNVANINWTNIIIAVILIAGLLGAIVYLVPKPSSGNTITVTGNFQTTVPPDQAVVYAQVQTRSMSTDDAKNNNSNVSDAVLTALMKAGIESKDIETQGYSISPEYDWTNNGQVFKGYVATNSIKITTKNFNDAGKIVDAAVDAGATINTINFELSNAKQNEYKASALANASTDAKNKAQAIATGLGKSLGNVVSVSTSDYGYVPYPIYRAGAPTTVDVKEVATNLPSGSVDITATVSVSYEIA